MRVRLGRAAALVAAVTTANITRIINPGAFSGNCAYAHTIGTSGDGRKSFALAFAGTNLWRPTTTASA